MLVPYTEDFPISHTLPSIVNATGRCTRQMRNFLRPRDSALIDVVLALLSDQGPYT